MDTHATSAVDDTSIRSRQTLRVYRYLATKNPYWRGRHLLQLIRPVASQDFYYNYGYEILGPIYATFMLGIIEEIRQRQLKQIYFLAREGELFLKSFQILGAGFFDSNDMPSTYYLYVSRRSTAAAAAYNGLTYETAVVPLLNPRQQGLYSICKAFGLPPDDFAAIAKKHGFNHVKQPILDWESSQFRNLIDDPAFQQCVHQHTSSHWQLLHTYLTQHQFFTESQVALVDIGWNGSIQKYLQDAFGSNENYPHVIGLYLGFIGGIKHRLDATKNTIVGILCDERNKARPNDIFSRFEEIFEESARALHSTTLGYQVSQETGQVVPLFKPDTDSDRIAELAANPQIARFQAGILDFCHEFARASKLTNYRFDDIKPFILTLAERAVAYPTFEESQRLMQLSHAEDFGSENMIDFGDEALHGWHVFLKPRHIMKKIRNANWKYGTASTLNLPGLNMLLRFYDLWKSR